MPLARPFDGDGEGALVLQLAEAGEGLPTDDVRLRVLRHRDFRQHVERARRAGLPECLRGGSFDVVAGVAFAQHRFECRGRALVVAELAEGRHDAAASLRVLHLHRLEQRIAGG